MALLPLQEKLELDQGHQQQRRRGVLCQGCPAGGARAAAVVGEGGGVGGGG